MLVTIVVPTYKEKENLKPLVERVFKALRAAKINDKDAELIVVDDNSKDGSVEVIEALAKRGYNARIIVRTKERGLSSAVLRGFDEGIGSNAQYLICMDADLQHPPESVPQLVAALRGGAPFVIGTRYAAGTAVDKDWPLHRRIISGGARMLARPLSALSDPMSGFFGLDAKLYQRAGASINPIGYKIALECFVKSGSKSFEEVPINFGVRTAGESKLDGKVIVSYLIHLWELYCYKYPFFPFLLLAIILFSFYCLYMILF